MKVDYIKSETGLRYKSSTQSMFQEKNPKLKHIMCDESSVNNKDNGSNMRNDNVAAINFKGKISEGIFKSKLFNGMLRFFEDKTALAQNVVALVVAGGFRPATNILMASKEDREDSYHAATHAISSAGVGFGTTCAVMKPFTDAVKRFKAAPAKYLPESMADFYKIDSLGPRKVQTSKIFKNTLKLVEMIPELSIGIPKAMLTIALIPPILKYCFGIEKGGKKDKPKVEITQQPQNVTETGKEVA